MWLNVDKELGRVEYLSWLGLEEKATVATLQESRDGGSYGVGPPLATFDRHGRKPVFIRT